MLVLSKTYKDASDNPIPAGSVAVLATKTDTTEKDGKTTTTLHATINFFRAVVSYTSNKNPIVPEAYVETENVVDQRSQRAARRRRASIREKVELTPELFAKMSTVQGKEELLIAELVKRFTGSKPVDFSWKDTPSIDEL